MAQSPAVEQGFGWAAVDQDFGPVGVFERRRGVGLDPNFGACGKVGSVEMIDAGSTAPKNITSFAT